MALTRSCRQQRCFTDGNGPDVFQKCALRWVQPHQKTLDEYGQYQNTEGNGRCSKLPPPSVQDKVCKSFHDKIAELR